MQILKIIPATHCYPAFSQISLISGKALPIQKKKDRSVPTTSPYRYTHVTVL